MTTENNDGNAEKIPFKILHVGKIHEHYGQKFIVGCKDRSLVYVAWPLISGQDPLHKDGAREYSIEYVLGGGRAGFDQGSDGTALVLCGDSGIFNGVAPWILEPHAKQIITAYQAIEPSIDSLVIATKCYDHCEWQLERWKEHRLL